MPRKSRQLEQIGFEIPSKKLPAKPKLKFVDLSKFKHEDIVVKVNDKPTDLNIGDSILVEAGEEEKVITVGGILINADKTISYVCEINNGLEIVSQPFSLFDLQRLQARI